MRFLNRIKVGLAILAVVAVGVPARATLAAPVLKAERSRFYFDHTNAPDELSLYAWKPYSDSPAFVIPVRAQETPEHAARAYLEKLHESNSLSKLFPDRRPPHLAIQNFSRLGAGHYTSQAILLANRANDFRPNEDRIRSFADMTAKADVTSYVLPLSADLNLSKDETRAYRELIANTFSLMIAMGGDDVDPSFYGEPNRAARQTNLERDASELGVIRHYVAKGQGFIFGTCRGHQLTSVALGYKLIQDIPTEIKSENSLEHASGLHSTHVFKTPLNFLSHATEGQPAADINTLHHQSVEDRSGGPLVVAARAPDGVIEALEFKNGHGFLVQFHPETMKNPLGERILNQVTVGQRLAAQRSCQALFASAQ